MPGMRRAGAARMRPCDDDRPCRSPDRSREHEHANAPISRWRRSPRRARVRRVAVAPTTGRSRRRSSRCRRTRRSAARRSRTSRSATRPTASSTRPATTRSSSRISSPALARGRQVQGDRRGARLLGPDHRRRPADRHRQVLRRQRRRARQPQHQGPERRRPPVRRRSIPTTGKPYGMTFPGRDAIATRCACTRRCSIRSASRSCRPPPARRAARSRRWSGRRCIRTTCSASCT